MKYIFFLIPLLLFGEICEEKLPCNAVLCSDLRGIILQGNDTLLSVPREGIHAQNVDVPGNFIHLKACLTSYLHKELTFETLAQIQKTTSDYYQECDRPLLTVGIPEQDITDGILRLTLIESTLGTVKSKGNRWFPDSMLTSQIRLERGSPITSKTIIEDIAWLNRNPYRLTNIVFTPGSEPNSTDIELITQDRFPLRFYGGGDNTGTIITGRARWFVGVDWAWNLLFDQIFSYQFTSSSDFKNLLSHTGSYRAFLPWRHVLHIYGGYASTKPDIRDFASEGYNAQGSLRYQMPLILFPDSFYLQPVVGFDYKLQRSSLIFTGQNQIPISDDLAAISQIVVGTELSFENAEHRTLFQWFFFWSPGEIFPHQSPNDFNTLRTGVVPNYLYSTLLLAYQYNYRFFTLWFQGRGQKATKPLIQSEEFALGGYDTVRGYDEREFISDNGFCFNIELRSPHWSLVRCRKYRDEWTFLVFFDYGLGTSQLHVNDEQKSTFLLGIGPGIRLAISPFLKFRLDYGFKLHKLHFEDTSMGKLHLGGLVSF